MQRGRHVKSQTTSPTVLPLEHDYSKLKDGSARRRGFFCRSSRDSREDREFYQAKTLKTQSSFTLDLQAAQD